jgi:mono/diheme cytochrome c family protein
MFTRTTLLTAALVGVLGVAIMVAGSLTAQQRKGGPEMNTQVEKGRYLVTIAGCNDCHSPKVFGPHGVALDTARLLSGHPSGETIPEIPVDALGPDKWAAVVNGHLTAWAGPWGVSFTANLTPDVGTGLGSWTEDMFIKTLRTGRHMGEGRPILPPMPWEMYAQATDEDLKAIFAYLQSLPPVRNPVPDPIPPAGVGH